MFVEVIGPGWLELGQSVEFCAGENPGNGAWIDTDSLSDLLIGLALMS